MFKKCPICQSEKIIKIEIEDIVNQLKANYDSIMSSSEISDDLKKLVSVEELTRQIEESHPDKFLCLSCGMGFEEGKDYSFYEKACPKEVSKEEFYKYLEDNCDDKKFVKFVKDSSREFEKYYIEVLEAILQERRNQIGEENSYIN